MPGTVIELKDRLMRAIDAEGNVLDMELLVEVITSLEQIHITAEELRDTRLGRFINVARRRTEDRDLAKRMKHLVKRWQQLVHNFQNGVSEQVPPTSSAPSPTPSLPPRSSVSPFPTIKKDSKLSRREQLLSKFSAVTKSHATPPHETSHTMSFATHKSSDVSNGSLLESLIVSIPIGKLTNSHGTKSGHVTKPMVTIASHMTKPIGATTGHVTKPIANVTGHMMTEPIVAMTGNMSNLMVPEPIVAITSHVTKLIPHMTDIGGHMSSLVVSVPLQKVCREERSPFEDTPTNDTPTIDGSPPTIRVNDVPVYDRGEYVPTLINKPNGHLATPPNNVSTCTRLYGDTPLPIGTYKATPTTRSPSPKKLHKLIVSIDRVYYEALHQESSPTPTPAHPQASNIKEEYEVKLEPYAEEDHFFTRTSTVADTCRPVTNNISPLPGKLKPPPQCQSGVDGCIGCDGNWYAWPDYIPGVDGIVTVLPYVYIDDWDIND